MLSRRLAAFLILLPAAACTDDGKTTTSDAARLIAAAGPHVVVAASIETEQPSLGCGGGGDPALGPSVMFVSDDSGVHYDRVEPTDARPLVRIGVKDGVFYGIAQGDGAASFSVMTSADGRSWTELIARPGVAHDLSLTSGGIAVAYSQGVLSSPDGVAWTDHTVTSGLYAPSVAQVGETLVLASPEDGTLSIANGTGWNRRPIAGMQSIWELIPADGALLATGTATLEGEPVSAIARIDLSNEIAPTFTTGSAVHPVMTPIGLLDTSGQLAAITDGFVGAPAPHVAAFQSAAVEGNTVQLLRDGSVSISADGGR